MPYGSLMGQNSPELQLISSRWQLHCKPKFNDAFDVDQVSMNDCELLETKDTLHHFRSTDPAKPVHTGFLKGKQKNNMKQNTMG